MIVNQLNICTKLLLLILLLNVASIATTLRAIPAAFGDGVEPDAGKMEPFNFAASVVAADHLAIWDLLTETVSWLVGVNCVKDPWRGIIVVVVGALSALTFIRLPGSAFNAAFTGCSCFLGAGAFLCSHGSWRRVITATTAIWIFLWFLLAIIPLSSSRGPLAIAIGLIWWRYLFGIILACRCSCTFALRRVIRLWTTQSGAGSLISASVDAIVCAGTWVVGCSIGVCIRICMAVVIVVGIAGATGWLRCAHLRRHLRTR